MVLHYLFAFEQECVSAFATNHLAASHVQIIVDNFDDPHMIQIAIFGYYKTPQTIGAVCGVGIVPRELGLCVIAPSRIC